MRDFLLSLFLIKSNSFLYVFVCKMCTVYYREKKLSYKKSYLDML